MDQQAADGPHVQFPAGRPVRKSRSTADLRVAAVGKLFTLIALAGVVAVHEGHGSRSIWRRLENLEWLPYVSVIYLYM